MSRVDPYPGCWISLIQRLRVSKSIVFVHQLSCVSLLTFYFWIVLLSIGIGIIPKKLNHVTKNGVCPEDCFLQDCKIYRSRNAFDLSPCSCKGVNSNNVTVTFCSDFLQKNNIRQQPTLSTIDVTCLVLATLTMISMVAASLWNKLLPQRYFTFDLALIDEYVQELTQEAEVKKNEGLVIMMPIVL